MVWHRLAFQWKAAVLALSLTKERAHYSRNLISIRRPGRGNAAKVGVRMLWEIKSPPRRKEGRNIRAICGGRNANESSTHRAERLDTERPAPEYVDGS